MVFRVVHFKIFWHWLILCKLMFTPDLSDWMAYHAPLIPWFWAFSWLCASNVCTPFRRSYAFYAKIHIFHQTSITEDNVYMWLPLAFQVQYFGFLHLFYCIACGSQGVPVATKCIKDAKLLLSDIMSLKLVYCQTFTLFNDKFHVLVTTESFQIKGSNYTRFFFHLF